MSMTTFIYAPTESEIHFVLRDSDARWRFFNTGNKSTPMLDLDKSWQGLHYLLTGSAWDGEPPTGFLINGGELIDLQMTSARVFWPKQVADIDEMLTSVTEDGLRRKFEPKAMMQEQVYPEIWDRDPRKDDTLAWLISNFQELKQFVSSARSRGACLVVHNEWPAGERIESIPAEYRVPGAVEARRRRVKIAGHVIAVTLCALVAWLLYLTQQRPAWPFVVLVAAFYAIAALILSVAVYFIRTCSGKRSSDRNSYWEAAETSIFIQGFVFGGLFVVAKLFGLL